MTDPQFVPLAIVGLGALFPGAADVARFWRDIYTGRDRITDVPPHYWLVEDHYDPDPEAADKIYVRRGGFLDKVQFDPLAFGIPPNLLPMTDTAQLLALYVARALIEDAEQSFGHVNPERVGVVLGIAAGLNLLGDMSARLQRPVWLKALREEGVPEDEARAICDRIADHYVPWNESTFPGLLGNVVAGRIANRFDFGGINCTADAACASSFSALRLAAHELALGHADLMITGGADAANDPFLFTCFSKTPALSPTEDCRPFAADADGTMLGEGVGMVALRRLADAERDGDRIYAVIRGIGASSDGRSKSVYAPRAEGQARALRRAYAAAGYGPETVELIEAHGTGTKAGDKAEFGGLKIVFDEAAEASGTPERQWCALGSIKSQIGHSKSAAASASLLKTVLALHHRVLPPTIKVARPNPLLAIESSPFYLNTEARPWIRDSAEHPRRASVSSFGFGGTNFHVALEEYAPDDRQTGRVRALDAELILLSGPDAAAVRAACATLLDSPLDGALAFVARETQAAFDAAAPARLALVADDEDGLRRQLGQVIARLDADPAISDFSLPGGAAFDQSPPDAADGLAYVFPGQGSQYVGMGDAVAMAFDGARAVWDHEAGAPVGDVPLARVVFPPPAFDDEARAAQMQRLTATEWSQPAIGAVSASIKALLDAVGLRPARVAGHSFGDISALYAAGALSEADFLRVARIRGELMARAADAAPVAGSMTAVDADGPTLAALLAEYDSPVVCANFNSPDQTVLSGPVDALETLEPLLTARGLRCRRLPVATAFHSPIVAGASAAFEDRLGAIPFGKPEIEVYVDATAERAPADADGLRRVLAEAIARPVRFVETVEAMYAAGARTFVEVGPGRVLGRLVSRCLGDRPHRVIATDSRRGSGVRAVWSALGQLAVRGYAMDLSPLWAEYGLGIDPRTRKPPKMAVPIDGSNIDRPYPPAGGAAALPKPNPPRPTPAPVASAPVHARPGPAIEAMQPVKTTPPPAASAPAPTAPAPTAPSPTAAAAPLDRGALDSLLAAVVELERQTAEAHQAWHRSTTEMHRTFLASSEATIGRLTDAIAGQRPLAAPQPAAVAAPLSHTAPTPVAPWTPPQAGPRASAPAPSPAWAPDPAESAPWAPDPAAAPRPAPVAAAAPLAAPAPAGGDLTGLLFAVVAETTGYPADVLDAGMSLEADLGIDSIKRVEILSAMQARVPGMPEIEPGALGAVETLADVVRLISAVAPAAPRAVRPPAGVDPEAVLLAVIAEKTGYPVDVLDTSMSLEADLGIDSIKRVEILSALQEQIPGMPEVDPAAMSALETVAQIIAQFAGLAPAPPAPAPSAPAPALTVDAAAALLAVVSEKTGYPIDVLDLDMSLEADLGIDSIKRVEILSAMQARLPGMPEVDPSTMSQLESLRDVVAQLGAPAAPTATPAARAPTAPAAAPTELMRACPILVDRPAPGFASPGLAGSRIAVTDDGAGLAPALVAALTARGLTAEIFGATDSDDETAGALIVLDALAPASDRAGRIALNRATFDAVRRVAAGYERGEGRLLVTVQDTGGGFGVDRADRARAWTAGPRALALTAAKEWPHLSVRAIDLHRGDRGPGALAAALAEELLTGGRAAEVGLSAERRRIIELVDRPLAGSASTPAIGPDDVVLVSGGARGVTATAIINLARARRPRLVLLGRTALLDETTTAGVPDDGLQAALITAVKAEGGALDLRRIGDQTRHIRASREIRETLATLAAAGSEARYLPVDIRDPAALGGALSAIRKDWGPITGLIHGAGVLADKRIADKTAAQFERVFETKVGGLAALLDTTAGDPLRALILFSSVAARAGNVGQSDYAMANAVLDTVAAAHNGPDCVARALAWGPWDGGMVTPALRGHFAAMGVPLIAPEAGGQAFVAELSAADEPPMVVLGGRLPDGPTERPLDRPAEVLVNGVDHAHFAGHAVRGAPVLPLAVVADWFAARLDDGPVDLRQIDVCRGVPLDHFADAPVKLTLAQSPGADGPRMTLSDAAGQLRYRATPGAGPAPAPLDPPTGDATWRWPLAELYAGGAHEAALFHRDHFAVIEALGACGADGVTGAVRGHEAMNWPGESPRIDPAAVDGALQLAVLWIGQQLDSHALPTAIGRLYAAAPVRGAGAYDCVVRVIDHSRSRMRFDIDLRRDGQPVLSLREVVFHALPAPGWSNRRSETAAS